MRHAILGAGGIGSLLGGALARAGSDVVLLLRPETLARHPRRIRVESAVLGDFEADVEVAAELDREVDVLWVSPKAPDLEAALALAPPERVGTAVVVPFLNGVDHVARLRESYERVLPGAFRVESERVEPGVVRQPTPFARVDLAPGPGCDEVADELRAAGFQVEVGLDEPTVLWEKLALLGPLALTTTAAGAPAGAVQAAPEWSDAPLRLPSRSGRGRRGGGSDPRRRGAGVVAGDSPGRDAHVDAEGLRCAAGRSSWTRSAARSCAAAARHGLDDSRRRRS